MPSAKKGRDMSHPSIPGPTVQWSQRHGFRPFGDRINFLSPEAQHLNTGRLMILPPYGVKKRRKA